ncbi:MAG: 3-hydroxyacyl-CoA dehydrogenase [Rhizobiales bacterium PAR1]|nr:MAG: 3-hydroxyacyl-CoA dehydrogenase [Rhizobiales bacterium PAR1]
MSLVNTTLEGDIALIEIDNPPVNATSRAVRQGLLDAIIAAEANARVAAIVIAGAGKTFVAGGDITEFGKPPMEPHLPDVMNRIEATQKPVVVAWHGTALGGGCELGLAAHARVIAPTGQLGLPEVKLGLVPGAGGTQRLPRLIGLSTAIGVITSGRMINAKEALAMGLADQIAEGDLRVAAIAHARSLIGKLLRRTGELPVPAFDSATIEKETAAVTKRARGQHAPVEGARLARLAAEVPVLDGMKDERATFLRLMKGEQSEALRYVFFAEREVAKRPEIPAGSARLVQKIGVIGAGTMGAGIAIAFLDAGHDVTVIETTDDALTRGRERIEGLYARSVTSGRLTEAAKAERLRRATFSTALASLSDVDLVIEAVFEEMTVKTELFTKLDSIVRPDCMLATNTSYLDLDAMAAALKDPSRLVGLHFFSPANVMKLLEIVRGAKTAPEVLATALAVGKRLKKVAVVSGVCDGFIGNRILAKYRAQCEFMLEEGALPQDIDGALEAYGFAMGPFAVSDLAGLDISWARRKRLAPTRPASERYVPIADRICEMGRFGQKTGAGWYRYVEGKRQVDPEIEALVKAHAAAKGLPQRRFTPEEIVTRVLVTMANEGAKIVEEGISARPLDVDIVLLNGYGFPAHRGGPMFQADRMGWSKVVEVMSAIEASDGPPYTVSAFATVLAEKGEIAAERNAL